MRVRRIAVGWSFAAVLCAGVALRAEDKEKTKPAGITVPFESSALEILLPVRIKGSETLWFSLDSGASSMILDPVRAKELGLTFTDVLPGSGAGAGPVMYSKIAEPVDIEVGGARSSVYDFISIDLSGVSRNIGHRMDGILGNAFFMKNVVAVDFQKKTVTLIPPDSFQPSGATGLPMEIYKRVPFIRGEVKVPGMPAEEFRMLVDSGSADAVDHPLIKQSKGKVIDTTSGVGLGTPIPGFVGRGEYFRLGPYRMERPVVSCCGSNEVNEKMIGNEILRRFEVTFDYPHQRLFLKPNRDLSSAFPYDCSGLEFDFTEDGRAFRVSRVVPGSPASEAGIRVGDTIAAIDRKPAGSMTLIQAIELFMRPGKTRALDLLREGKPFTARLKLREIL